MAADVSDWQICARTQDRLGESVAWHPTEQALYWVDFYGPIVHRQREAKGPVESWTIAGGAAIGSLVFVDGGRLLLALDHGLHLFDPASGATRFFADPKNGTRHLAYNDAKVDRAGRYWIGTYDVTEVEPRGVFFQMAANGTASRADHGFVVCNGPAFAPDNRALYFSDTVGRRILSYDLARDGTLSGRRTFFAFSAEDGLPDGLAVDSAGHVWCALYGAGKVVCITAAGTAKQSLPLPAAHVTSLCFGGPDLKTLYVTSGWSADTTRESREQDIGGSVFMRGMDLPGLPEPVFSLP
ncbi:MAG: SMP-30/gluconolactonase/LRE family protein [Parvibaculaceae bacterium]